MNKALILIVGISLLLSGCAGVNYSLTGSSLPPEIKTVSIYNFTNSASNSPANLEITFTERLKEYYQRNTKLNLVNSGGDLLLDGEITNYTVQPVSSSGTANQIADQQRLTIVVKVAYQNSIDSEKDFTQSFSFFRDFPASKNLSDVESTLTSEIFDAIMFDIFNKTVADW